MALKNLPKICPSCGKRLSVQAMHCNGCDTHIEGDYNLPVMMQLSAPDQQFVLDFVKSSGSLKEMAQKLGLSYPTALLFSPSRIRAVDIFATNLFAMLPTIVILGVLSVPSKWLGGLVCEPRSACEVMKLAGYNLIVILLSVSMVWSMVWGCFAYLVSANMKGWRGISIFVICYVFVSVVNQLLIAYSK